MAKADGTRRRNCDPGFVLNGAGACVPPSSGNKTQSFYMYRAQGDVDYVMENVNAASLAGVMWYLEKEVVRGTCPRHYGITRIMRIRVTVHSPPELSHSFGSFFAFDRGKCTAPGCLDFFNKYGFVVGCQNQTGTPYGPSAVWYSLPGACPLVDFKSKPPSCLVAQPGGRCPAPTGEKTCAWSYVDAGSISIAELEGIPDYKGFCASGGNEYVLGFWDGRGSPTFSQDRIRKAQDLFKSKYPGMPHDLPKPVCDWA